MAKKPSWYYRQTSAVPFRIHDGEIEVMLITTRKKKHWIFPKGIIEPDHTPQESAAMEAFEEAGVKGEVLDPPVGTYTYQKWGGVCTVEVYVMRVTKVLKSWQEEKERKRKWVSLTEARHMVRQLQLRQIVRLTEDWFLRHGVELENKG